MKFHFFSSPQSCSAATSTKVSKSFSNVRHNDKGRKEGSEGGVCIRVGVVSIICSFMVVIIPRSDDTTKIYDNAKNVIEMWIKN